MKCLEKDRNRRYETANASRPTSQRYLHDEPVQACPPSMVYRLRKFARRNKTLLVAGGAIAAALFIGLGLLRMDVLSAATESARAQAVSDVLQEMLTSSNPDQTRAPSAPSANCWVSSRRGWEINWPATIFSWQKS